jgi:hypothetical protein
MALDNGSVNRRWDRASKSEAGSMVVKLIDQYAQRQGMRREAQKYRLRTYLGQDPASLSADMFEQLDPTKQLDVIPVAQTVVHAAVAKIAAKQQPKPQVLTKGGNYKHRIQAKYISRFFEGVFRQPQGRYANAWELTRHVFKDACLREAGVIKVWGNPDTQQIVLDRRNVLEYFVDPLEAERGNPRSLHERYRYPKRDLCERFPSHERAIMAAPLHSDDNDSSTADRSEHMCSVYESCSLPGYDGKPGRHIIAVAGQTGPRATLVDEDWHWPTFNSVFLLFEPNLFGMWSRPPVDLIAAPQEILNDTIRRMALNIRLTAGGYVDCEQGAYEDADLVSNAALKVMERKPGAAPCNITMPPAFNPQTMQFLDMIRAACFEVVSVSEMNATGRIEAGVTAAIAMRTANDRQNEMFLPHSRAYEQLHASLGRLILQAARDLEAQGVNLEVGYQRGGLMDLVDWKTIKPEREDMFEVMIDPVNSAEDTLSARQQTISELGAGGSFSPETTARLLTSPNPDLESFNKRERAQFNYLERLIGRYREVDFDEFDTIEDWLEEGEWEGPDPYLNLDAAILQFTDGYIEALDDGAPEFNRELLRRWMKMADVMIQERSAQANGPAAAPQPGGPGPGMPMDPGMAPGMEPQLQMAPPMPPEQLAPAAE